jgi:hypothetical protein
MLRNDLISSLFWVGASVLIILGSLRLQFGVPQNPGPGFLPFLVGLLLLILSLALLIRSLRGRREKESALATAGVKNFKLFGTVAALLLFALIFPYLGFLLTTIPLMIFLSRAIGGLNWKTSLAIGILISFSMYILFKLWLNVQFPPGPWGI